MIVSILLQDVRPQFRAKPAITRALRCLAGKQGIGVEKSVTRHRFAALNRSGLIKHRSGMREGMKLAVFTAGIDCRRQAAHEVVVEIAADEIGRQLRGIRTNDAGTQGGIQHF